jgi:hypothetical protein
MDISLDNILDNIYLGDGYSDEHIRYLLILKLAVSFSLYYSNDPNIF